MIENLPAFISCLFILTTLLTQWLLLRALPNNKAILVIIPLWLIIQAAIAWPGFYTITDTIPPRFLLLVLPPLLTIICLFISSGGRKFIDSADTKWLTWLHIVRLPVELTLLFLFMYRQVPLLMTFEGRNFDILSGITAPFIAYYGYTRKTLSRAILLLWNFVCLGLLINIVTNAILSMPLPFQQFAFDQPNTGLFYFPFVWLPCFIVPAVLFSHLICIRQLLKK